VPSGEGEQLVQEIWTFEAGFEAKRDGGGVMVDSVGKIEHPLVQCQVSYEFHVAEVDGLTVSWIFRATKTWSFFW
jgi:hypothetical protein